MANSEAAGGGIGFIGLLTILFIALKLTRFIDWTWLWVLSPMWIPAAVALGICLGVGIIAFVMFIAERVQRSWN